MLVLFRYYLFVALILYKSVGAYVGIILPEGPKPEKFAGQEGCYLSDYDRMLEVDVPFSPKNGSTCQKYHCRDSGEIHFEGCSPRGIGPNCETIPADLSQANPDCCEKVRCTLPDGKVVVI